MNNKCSTLECYSKPVAISDTDRLYCIECSIKVYKQWGPGSLKTLDSAKFPWEDLPDFKCLHCGLPMNQWLIGLTGDCTKCRKPLSPKLIEAIKNERN